MSKYPMVSVEEALGAVMDAVEPLDVEKVPLVRKAAYGGSAHSPALGRVVARAVVADAEHPPFAAAISDGYAFAATGQVMKLRLEEREQLCGGAYSSRPLGSGDCCYIATGAPLPHLADCVAKEEDCDVDGAHRTVVVPALAPRADVRAKGSDWKAGDVLVEAGDCVSPADVAILAAAGQGDVVAHRLPRVVVFSTGDELYAPDHERDKGAKYDPRVMVRDANRAGLIALLSGKGDAEGGAEVFDGGVLKDDAQTLRHALDGAVKQYDVVVTTGGASVGRADHAKAVLEHADRCVVKFGRLHMKPGKPTTFATLDAGSFDKAEARRDARWLFALPGNPVSALVTARLLVVPALKRLRGFGEADAAPTEVRLRLDHDVALDAVRPEFHRVALEWRDDGAAVDWSHAPFRFRNATGELVATSTGNQRSSRLLSMRGAAALACLPERGRASLVAPGAVKALPAGACVPGLLLGPVPPLVVHGDAPFLRAPGRAVHHGSATSKIGHVAERDVPKVAAVALVNGVGDEATIRAHVVTRVDAANAAAAVIARATGLAMYVRDGPPVVRANDAPTIHAALATRADEATVLVVCGGLDVNPNSPPVAKALDDARKAPGLARAMALVDDNPLEVPMAAILGSTLVLVLPTPATRAARCARAAAPALPAILAQLKGPHAQ